MKTKKIRKRILWSLLIVFILMNIVAAFHAYKFTHFASDKTSKTKSPDKLSAADKIKTLFFGVDNPRPESSKTPSQKFETFTLQSNKKIECWYIKTDSAKGTVILFHGYSGEKSSSITYSDEFIKLGYNTVLVDFMGSGGSEGNQTTIGYKEAEEVKTVYDHVREKGEKNIYLFGSSLGAVAIMKAINDHQIKPAAIILECPFGSMYTTTCARFKNMNVPTFPMAALLVFWGGVENNFWAFGHQPTNYAKKIQCPTLLLYGEKDKHVSREEIDEIYANLDCKKELKIYPLAGHENYLKSYQTEWIRDVRDFIATADE